MMMMVTNILSLHTLTLMILGHDLMFNDFFFFLGKKHFVEKFYDLGQKYLCSWT